MKFTRKEFGKVHIEMMFVRKYNISDGRELRIGYGLFPYAGGDILLDDEENWSLDSYNSNNSIFSKETNLLMVAAHELGHALGLDHLENTTALMAPGGTSRLVSDVKLYSKDMEAIQALYGAQGQPRPQIEDIEEVNIEAGNRR